MNLAEMLSFADIQELSRIALNYECSCSRNSKNELIQSILNCMNGSEIFRQEVERMEWEELRFLNSLLYDSRDSFSLEELIARVRLAAYESGEKEKCNPREVISRFKSRGWLFTGHSRQTNFLFIVPEDLKRRFRDTLVRKFFNQLTSYRETPGSYRDEQQLLSLDLQKFLTITDKNDLPLNAEGFLYKRSLQQILESFQVAEAPVAKTAWRFGYGRRFREYPDRFSLMYDYCFYHGLIDDGSGSILLTEKGKQKVLSGEKEPMRELYLFWLKVYKSPVPNIQSLVQWVVRLARQWTTVDSLSQALRHFIKPFYYDSAESIFETRIIGMMVHLGMLRFGEHEDFGTSVQVTPLGDLLAQGALIGEEERILLPD